MGLFEDSIETVFETVSGSGGYINKDANEQRMEQINSMPEHKAGSVLGEINNFQTPRAKSMEIESAVMQEHTEVVTSISIESKREEIARLNGLQPDFEGVMNSRGEVYTYYEANATKKVNETEAMKIQREREEKLSAEISNKKSGLGENDLVKREGNSAVGGVGDNTVG